MFPPGSLWRPTQPQADVAWPWWVAGLLSERGSSWPRVTPAGRALLAEGGPGCPGGTASWVAKEVLWISLESWSRRCGSEPLQSCTHCAPSAAFLPWALRVCGQLPVSAAMSVRQASSVVVGRRAGAERWAVEAPGDSFRGSAQLPSAGRCHPPPSACLCWAPGTRGPLHLLHGL